MTNSDPSWVVLAHLLRPQGRKGELLAELLTDFPERFEDRKQVFLAPEGFSSEASAARATEVILIDMPLWMHFSLAAERQIAWATGAQGHAPGGILQMTPTRGLFRSIWDVDQNWMPGVRALCDEAEAQGKMVTCLASVDDLDGFARMI